MKLTISQEKKKVEKRILSQVFALLPIYLLQFTYGMNTGFPAILTPQLTSFCSPFVISSNEESWIVSLDNIAPPVVCILFGVLQHQIGPRSVLMLGCLPYFLGWLLTALASSVSYIYTARFFVGIGHAVVSTTVYTVEVSSRDLRGTFSLFESVLRCSGCLLTYTLGSQLSWKTIAMFATLIPFSAVIIAMFVPESPAHLVLKGKLVEARAALVRLYGPECNVDEQIHAIQESLLKRKIKEKPNQEGKKFSIKDKLYENTRHFRRPEVYKPFMIIMTLSVMQQFSGMSILRAYVVKIFNNIFGPPKVFQDFNQTVLEENSTLFNCTDDGRSGASSEAYYSAIILGFLRLVASLLLSQLLLTHSRRRMYFISLLVSVLSLLGVATFNYVLSNWELDPQTATVLKWSTLASAGSLVFAVQLGVQTLPTLLSGELFPSEVRAFCKGFCRSLACVLLVICLKSFPILEKYLTFYGTFYFFAAVLILSFPIIYYILPETKGVALELVQHYFTKQKTVFYIDLENNPVKESNITITQEKI